MAVERGEILALLDQVLKGCGVRTRGEFAEIINDEDGVQLFVEGCRLAVAQAVAPPLCADHSVQTETATATAGTTMGSFVNAVSAVPTATVSTETISCRKHNAQAQTARTLISVGTAMAVQTATTAISMVDAGTTAESTLSTANMSTDTFLDKVNGLSHTSSQTEGCVVAASDHEQLGDQLVASIVEGQRARRALVEEKAALDGLVTAIVNRKRIDMNGTRYNVWCEGEAEAAGPGDAPYGIYVLPSRTLVLG